MVRLSHYFFIIFLFLFLVSLNLAAAHDQHNLRIAIIGAGVSGLTAGHYLQKEGYHHISVFEQEDRVGGKIHTQHIDGHPYELGAVWVFPEYKITRELAAEYGVPLRRYPSKKAVLTGEGRRLSFFNYAKQKYGLLGLIKSYWNAKRLLTKYPELKRPGLNEASSDLFENFDDFVKRNKVEAIAYMMMPFLVGCGYGYARDVPALYYMKPTMMLFDSLVASFFREHVGGRDETFQFFPGGYQLLWEKVAAGLDVHLSTKVQKILRKTGALGVEIISERGSLLFDKIIISSPPDATLQYLDASEEESLLFSSAKHYYYDITAFRGSGIPRDEIMFLEKATHKSQRGTPAVIGNPIPTANIWLSLHPYETQGGFLANTDLAFKLGKEVALLGGRLDEIIFKKSMTYFFHFNTEDLRRLSPYKRLESMQGSLNTYYLGGIFNFESVEHNAEYAKQLVHKHLR